jgi:hypothetical protein
MHIVHLFMLRQTWHCITAHHSSVLRWVCRAKTLSDPCADVKLDRKSLSELAKNEPLSFQQIVAVAKSALASNFDKSSQNASKEAQ